MMEESFGDKKDLIHQACEKYDLFSTEEKENIAEVTESIAKFGPFKTWILTYASSVWIQLVSLTGLFVTGILLIFYLLNFVERFSDVPW